MKRVQRRALWAASAGINEMPYQEYLKSRHWHLLRAFKLEESGAACERCGDRNELQIHHVFYQSDRTRTKLSHLQVLCSRCHSIWHANHPNYFKTASYKATESIRARNPDGRLLPVRNWPKEIKPGESIKLPVISHTPSGNAAEANDRLLSVLVPNQSSMLHQDQ